MRRRRLAEANGHGGPIAVELGSTFETFVHELTDVLRRPDDSAILCAQSTESTS